MFSKILRRRPEIAVRGWNDAATAEGQEKTGGVRIEADLARGDDVDRFGSEGRKFFARL